MQKQVDEPDARINRDACLELKAGGHTTFFQYSPKDDAHPGSIVSVDEMQHEYAVSPSVLDHYETKLGRKIERRKINETHLSAFDFSAKSVLRSANHPVAFSHFDLLAGMQLS